MKKYNVVIHYEGAFALQVEADNEEQAEERAEQIFDEFSDRELVDNLAEIKICDCWEEQ